MHKYWRCHNKEFRLSSFAMKELYLESTLFGLKHRSTAGRVKLHAYCVMDNHSHQELSYEGESKYLSNFMRCAHSIYGRKFNNHNLRTGKVANERPHTPLIQPDDEHLMRTHFYIEANPIRAGVCNFEQLKFNQYNSFRFYAYGIKDKFSENLTIPKWYMDLGRTTKERQENYRELFKIYLEIEKVSPGLYKGRFIGSSTWRDQMNEELKARLKQEREKIQNSSAPPGQ